MIQGLKTIQTLQGTRLTKMAEELRQQLEENTEAESEKYNHFSEFLCTLRQEQVMFQNNSGDWREQMTAHMSTLHQERFEQIQKDLKSIASQSEYLFQTFAQELTALDTQISDIAQPIQHFSQNARQNWEGDT